MIAYDTNILIYALEGTSPWAAAAQAIVQKGEQDGAALSVLAWQEIMTGVALRGEGMEGRVMAALTDLGATRFIPVTPKICERAVGLTKIYGKRLYGYDAIHIATAIDNKAELFITNDKVLLDLRLNEILICSL